MNAVTKKNKRLGGGNPDNTSLLRVGVVGAGHMGSYHINVLSHFNDIVFLGIYDLDLKRAKKIAGEYNIHAYSTLTSLLKEADAIILATPTSTHYNLARLILEAGNHILIEKPLTANIEEAHELSKLATEKQLKLFVGHVERYNGAVQELENLVTNPYCWESRRVGPGSRRIEDSGVGLDLLIHDIDICLRTFKGEIASMFASSVNVPASGAYEDVINAQLTFADGSLATFFASRLSHRKERSLTITTADHTLLLDFTTQDIHLYSSGEAVITTLPKEIRYQQQSSVKRLMIHKANPLELELRDFIASIYQDKPVDNTVDLKTLDLTLKLIAQAKERSYPVANA
ncbi:hypothetical protein COTS27_01149 [Spirochaetota bacterium]|nr:hypothetical protein COTS27_01149 [Spirochaetota bacterium]